MPRKFNHNNSRIKIMNAVTAQLQTFSDYHSFQSNEDSLKETGHPSDPLSTEAEQLSKEKDYGTLEKMGLKEPQEEPCNTNGFPAPHTAFCCPCPSCLLGLPLQQDVLALPLRQDNQAPPERQVVDLTPPLQDERKEKRKARLEAKIQSKKACKAAGEDLQTGSKKNSDGMSNEKVDHKSDTPGDVKAANAETIMKELIEKEEEKHRKSAEKRRAGNSQNNRKPASGSASKGAGSGKPAAPGKAGGKKADDGKAVKKKADDKKAAEKKAGEKKADDGKAAKKKADDKKSDDTVEPSSGSAPEGAGSGEPAASGKSDEKKTDDSKAVEKKTDEKKAAEKKADEKKADGGKAVEKEADEKKADEKVDDGKAVDQEKVASPEVSAPPQDERLSKFARKICQPSLRCPEHSRIRRWQTTDPGTIRKFEDKKHSGERILRYENLSDDEILVQRARHYLPGTEHLLRDPAFRSIYTFPTERGYGVVARLSHNQTTVDGILNIGIGKSDFVFHKHFKEADFSNAPRDPFQDVGNLKEREDAGAKLWKSQDDDFALDVSEKGVLEFTYPGHTLQVHPFNFNLFEKELAKIAQQH